MVSLLFSNLSILKYQQKKKDQILFLCYYSPDWNVYFWKSEYTQVFSHSSQENDTTLEGRAKSDAREMQSFYRHYYQKYIQALQNAADKDR
jgi:hypothetical protein